MSDLLSHDVLVISQKAKIIEMTDEYRVFDDAGIEIGTIRELEQSTTTKEKPGCWTHQRAFAQVRHDSNIQLLSFSLVSSWVWVTPRMRENGGGLPADVWCSWRR
jgi:hypothetical protein